MRNKQIIFCFLLFMSANLAFGQNKILDSLISVNKYTFQYGQQFSGTGWDKLLERVGKTNYLMIGEDHFISEIPLFTKAILQSSRFDNYIAEVDPWMMQIFQDKISKLSGQELDKWISSNYNGFSFFQKKNEFDLLTYMVKEKIKTIGFEQIALMSTSIIYQYLIEKGSVQNRKLYTTLRDSSIAISERFFADLSQPFFMATASFDLYMNQLNRKVMKKDEQELIDALVASKKIYVAETGSHIARIKLMQSNFIKYYNTTLKGKRNVFKFGANHAMKGESYIPVYDIGTTANVLAQSENSDSYHVLVLPKTGKQAGFLSGSNNIDLSEPIFAELQPLFKQASDTDWTFIELDKIRKVLHSKKQRIESSYLEKTIKGFDAIVILPVATAAAAVK